MPLHIIRILINIFLKDNNEATIMPEVQQSVIEKYRAGGGHVLRQPFPAIEDVSGGYQVPAVRGDQSGSR